jgi:hypothetical protein
MYTAFLFPLEGISLCLLVGLHGKYPLLHVAHLLVEGVQPVDLLVPSMLDLVESLARSPQLLVKQCVPHGPPVPIILPFLFSAQIFSNLRLFEYILILQ